MLPDLFLLAIKEGALRAGDFGCLDPGMVV